MRSGSAYLIFWLLGQWTLQVRAQSNPNYVPESARLCSSLSPRTDIGAAHGKSGPQVALRWVRQHGVPLATRSTRRQHLADNLDLSGWELSDDEMARLDAATEPMASYSFMCSE